MAGSFGFEAEHYDASMAMAELSLLPSLEKVDADTLVVAMAPAAGVKSYTEQVTGHCTLPEPADGAGQLSALLSPSDNPESPHHTP